MPRAVILTALPVEYLAVSTHLTNTQEEMHPQGTVYERGQFAAGSQTWEVGLVEIGAGNPGAALEAERAIAYFNPDVILFVGVAGGIKDVALGDVVASTKVYGYESGKAEETFRPRPEVGLSAYGLEQRARAEARKTDWLQRLPSAPSQSPKVYVAPIAAGEKVVASIESEVFQFLRSNYGDAIAVEMEGFGFLNAARANQRIPSMVIRGISDLIYTKTKTDQVYQEIAARHASAFAFEVLANLNVGSKAIEYLSASRKRRLEEKRYHLQLELKLNSEEYQKLYEALISTVSASEKVLLERQIHTKEKQLNELQAELDYLNQELSFIPYSEDEINTGNTRIPGGFELKRKLLGHEDFITRISWSPNGQMLASPSVDGTICIWEKRTGQLYRKIKDDSVSVFSVAWSPDSKSLAAASDDNFVRVWNVITGELYQKIEGCTDVAFDIAWSPNGEMIALGLRDNTIQLWDVSTWTLRQTLRGHSDVVWVLHWSPDSYMLASGAKDQTIRLWNAATGKVNQVLVGHSSDISSLSWSTDGKSLASAASHDLVIRIWNCETGQATNLLEGHTKAISCVDFSFDRRFLASKSEDNTVQLWSCRNWKRIAILDEPMDSNMFRSLAFHPSQSVLATTTRRDHAIQIWHLDVSLLESQITESRETIPVILEAGEATVYYTSAKIVLVGESNVGKSCLALRLAENRYEEQGTTHGMRLWTMLPEQLSPESVAPEGEKRDVVLWDMGGQDEYRLVHQLFLHDTTLALVLFDPTRGRSAFEEVEAWSKRLEKQLQGRKAVKLLVGTKLDENSSVIDQTGLARLIQDCSFVGYYPTSAKNNRGIAELCAAISQELGWDAIARISRPELFQTIRDRVEQLRKDGKVILFYSELEDYIYQHESHNFEDLEVVAVNDVLQGAIADTQLASGERALILRIDEIERYAGSVIIAARNNLSGIPAIEEKLVASPQMTFPGIKREERLARADERFVLECVIQLLIQHGICLHHEGLLIFPALFQPSEKEGVEKIPHSISLYYDFSGAIDNIYSSLVTKLAISEWLGPVRLWEDRAEFKSVDQGTCGLRIVERHSGLAHLDLYFDQDTPDDRRNLFIAFVEEHLQKQGVEVYEHVEIICACGYGFAEHSIRKRVADGWNDIGCPECDQRTKISEGAQQTRERDLSLESRLWALKTTIEDNAKIVIQDIKNTFEQPDMPEIVAEPIRVLHLPGNHDLRWYEEGIYPWRHKRLLKTSEVQKGLQEGRYVEQGEGYLVRNEERYPQRFKNFSEIFYHPLMMEEYPLNPEEQAIPYLFTDTGIQFLALNSAWETDEYFPERSSISEAALSRGLIAADKQIIQAKQSNQLASDSKVLRIAVWHHPVTGNEKMQQDAFLDRLRQADYKLCLHGHIHEERTDIIGYLHPTRKVHVAGTGSFGAPSNARPESTPRLYNLLEIERNHSKIRVHTRCLRKDGGAWEGWAAWTGGKSTERRTYYDIKLGQTTKRGKKATNKTGIAKKKDNLASKDQEIKRVDNSLVDFVIITAIKVERLAILKAFEIDETRDRIRKGSRTYWRKRLLLQDGKFYEIAVAQSLDMANVNAAILTNDTLHHWNPAAVLMVGIAATAKPETKQHLGNLVIGREVYC